MCCTRVCVGVVGRSFHGRDDASTQDVSSVSCLTGLQHLQLRFIGGERGKEGVMREEDGQAVKRRQAAGQEKLIVLCKVDWSPRPAATPPYCFA
jgi:hypothetical protein